MKIKNITLRYSEKDFKKLENMKESAKIVGKCENWEDFFWNLSTLFKL